MEVFNGDVVNRAMLEKVRQLSEEGVQPDLIIITGNIAHAGKADEYGVASVFFRELLKKTKLTKEQLFVVPGNRDVDKDEIDDVLGKSIYEFATQDDITKILTHKTLFPHLMNKFTHFFDFANAAMGSRYYTGELFYYTETTTIVKNNTRFLINLAGINSALFSRSEADKDTKLACGIYQVNKIINQLEKSAALNIGFLHHPLSSMHTIDKPAANMLMNSMDIILSGHLADPDGSFSHTAAGKAVMLCAGASFTKRDAYNSFEMIDLDLATGEGTARFYKYLPDFNIWKINTDVNPATTDGSFSFTINLKKKVKPDAGSSLRSTVNPVKYLRWLHDECAYINIRGIVARAKHAYQFNIDEFYIPLASTSHFAQRNEKAGFNPGKPGPGSDISLDKALVNQYTTIVGDPGSGKTTYVRRISYLLAKGLLKDDNSHEKLGLAKGTLPVFIKIEELSRFIAQSRSLNRADTPTLDAASSWLVYFLNEKSKELGWDLPGDFFKDRLESKKTIVVLDGLDEAPDITMRQQISAIVLAAITAWPDCKFIVTTRLLAYKGTIVLEKFTEFTIAPLREAAIDSFLLKWAQALTRENLLTATTDAYYDELKNALRTRPAMQRMTSNPIMLTALAVVHWNERKLPEGRANLYHSIINWLLISRKDRTGRLTGDTCRSLLQKIALAMQMHPKGRQVNAGRRWAAEQIYTDFPGNTNEEKIQKAEQFLEQEEVDSGIIVSRGNNLTFWHLTFQEYLAALALGGKMETEQQLLLIKPEILHNPDWREVLLLFGSILYNQGTDKIDGFLAAILKTAEMKEKTLADEARCAGLIGAIIRDVPADNYALPAAAGFQLRIQGVFHNTLYKEMLDRVMEIFHKDKAHTIPLDVRVSAADALGQAGDERFAHPEKNWIEIPECTFLMGAQAEDKKKPNYDPDAESNESPVHEVTLSAYKIGTYPVTVGEYKKFIQADGYTKEEYWTPEGWQFITEEKITLPESWADQELFLTRPVTGVSWFEGAAYAKWMGADLPTEAEWERAARGGVKYKKYPWGEKPEPDGKIVHSGHNKLRHVAPVGIFPASSTKDGAVDMAGNVLEWCKDWYDADFYEKSKNSHDPVNFDTENFKAIGEKQRRILRGGCWYIDFMLNFRCSYRGSVIPTNRINYFGFRVVLRSQAHGNPKIRP
ncbi:MAG: SUMF1/EgtB/PvdO family nonheme iron enzyme [Spirochaetales bacterium]|nr:SUMF1/EgtB/PvdO family nonheme iron enzyme [Spirochaetales bacterium]